MGGIGNCCCGTCELLIADLPAITIANMSVLYDWFKISQCCAMIVFKYDTPQGFTVLDGGDVMTYDKTEICQTETFHYPFTCGSVTQSFWSENGEGEIATIGSSPKPNHLEGTQPTYDCCPATPISIATLTKTVRSRGGQRFFVELRADTISVVILKVEDYVCSPSAAVTKYIIRSTINYSGRYLYGNYNELSTTYAADEGVTDIDCWEVPADSVVGSPTFDLYNYDPADIVAYDNIASHVCREKVLTSLPSVVTNYTFANGDIPNPDCVFNECIICDENLQCWSSGPTGDAEPTQYFCDATVVTAESEAGSVNICGTNAYYFWGIPNCYPDGYVYITVPQNMTMCCNGFASPNNPADYCETLDEWASWTTAHPGYGGIIGYCDYMVSKATADHLACFPTYACDECPAPEDQVGNSDPDLVVGVVTSDPINYDLHYRILAESRTVTCSGYNEVEVCQSFSGWTITVTPPGSVMPAELTLSFFAPTVLIPTTITPATASLTLTTFAPSANLPGGFTPSNATLMLATFAPTIAIPSTLTPTTATLTLATFAPTIAKPILATPTTATLTISRFAPSAGSAVLLTPTTATLTLTTFAPSAGSPILDTPTTATLTLATFAPTIVAPILSTPTTATLTLTTFVPSAGSPILATPTTATLTLATFAPTIVAPILSTPTTATLTLTTFISPVSTPVVETPTIATLTLTTFAPTLYVPILVVPDTESLTLSSFVSPILTPVVETPTTIDLILTTFAPTVTGTVSCPSDPCTWIWLEASWEWIEDTFNCADALYDDCICNDPPTRAGEYDAETLVSGDCGTVPVETPIPMRRSLFLTTFEPTVTFE